MSLLSNKGGLISEKFSLWLKSPEKKIVFEICINQSEKFHEIKPPFFDPMVLQHSISQHGEKI